MTHIHTMLQLLEQHKDPAKAKDVARFFKTGKGQYGEGDIFWGISVPMQRRISKTWAKELDIKELELLLSNPVHEVRLTTLLCMILQYQQAKDASAKEQIVKVYLANSRAINNWDLVDLSCYHILGDWLLDKDWSILKEMASSDDLWTNRIAMVSTYAFIKKDIYQPTLLLATMLLNHQHDLIHKAVGWMLRELGKRDFDTQISFMKENYHKMPRTMLRYAIERFEEDLRQDYLKGRV